MTDRSGVPRLEVAPLDGGTPAVLSRPTDEVVSVAWSPDGAWLAYLVSPSGSICAELHVVRPDGTGHRVLAGQDARATVFAGGWTGPDSYACSIAAGDGPDADVVLVDVVTGELRTLATGGFLSVTSVSADERFVLARRGPRGYRHIVVVDVATGVQRRALDPAAPGGVASEDGRFGADGRCLYLRASLPGELFADRAGLVAVPLSEDGVPGEGRVLLRRPDADLDGYALRSDGTVLAVWNTRRDHRAAGARPRRRLGPAGDRAARRGDAGLVAVGRRRHHDRRGHRAAEPASAVDRPDHRGGGPRPARERPAAARPRPPGHAGRPRLSSPPTGCRCPAGSTCRRVSAAPTGRS